jgi:hypothetical protein
MIAKYGQNNPIYANNNRVFEQGKRYDYKSLTTNENCKPVDVLDAMMADVCTKIIPKMMFTHVDKKMPNEEEEPLSFDHSFTDKNGSFLKRKNVYDSIPTIMFISKVRVNNVPANFKDFSRQINSFLKTVNKFLTGFEDVIDYIFDESDAIVEQIASMQHSNANAPPLADPFVPFLTGVNTIPMYTTSKCDEANQNRFIFFDGFFGEGKTQLLTNMSKFNFDTSTYSICTELDTTFRSPFKNASIENSFLLSSKKQRYYKTHISQEYYKLFVVIGHLYAIRAAFLPSKERTTVRQNFFLDRFFSHIAFDSTAKTFLLDFDYMLSFCWWLNFSRTKNYTSPFTLAVNIFEKVNLPYPIKETREMEMVEYEDEPFDMFERFKDFYSKAFFGVTAVDEGLFVKKVTKDDKVVRVYSILFH